MEIKDLILIIFAALGWVWGVIQFIINRKNQKKDKLVERKYEAYSVYMRKIDEIMYHIRKNPNMIYDIYIDCLKKIFSCEPEEMNENLIVFNEKLLDYVKTATEPVMIIKQELNALLIICSNKLRGKINELIELLTDFNNEMQKCLSILSPNDSNSMTREFQTLAHADRWSRFQTLKEEILEEMREEIGSSNK